MNTPILDFVREYAGSDISRFHMPGHKGSNFIGCEKLDITEIEGADVLYTPEGIILESENNATGLFRSAHTFYSCEGSSLAIKAMLAMVVKERRTKDPPLILAARNVHKAFVYGCALLDIEPEWIYPASFSNLCSCIVSKEQVKSAVLNCRRVPDAVYITSPDYLGHIADIRGISEVCREFDIPLLVDNAHGAYLNFLNPSLHPLSLGATACCDSAHKTLPSLTGGAYLHISENANPAYLDSARDMLSVFASTSPSYLILQSLDFCNKYIADSYASKLQECAENIDKLKSTLIDQNFEIEQGEKLKLVIRPESVGYTGGEMAEYLRKSKIEVEFADKDYVVLMFTPEIRKKDYERLYDALANMEKRPAVKCDDKHRVSLKPERKMSIREAIFAPSETVSVRDACGRICASVGVSCPPAVPIVMSGEAVPYEAIELFEIYGVEKIKVVRC